MDGLRWPIHIARRSALARFRAFHQRGGTWKGEYEGPVALLNDALPPDTRGVDRFRRMFARPGRGSMAIPAPDPLADWSRYQ